MADSTRRARAIAVPAGRALPPLRLAALAALAL